MASHKKSKFKIGQVLCSKWIKDDSSKGYVILDITRTQYVVFCLTTKHQVKFSRFSANRTSRCKKDIHFDPAVLKIMYSRAGT